jgi:hypothetical protein
LADAGYEKTEKSLLKEAKVTKSTADVKLEKVFEFYKSSNE